jgi:hypothetical protein
MKKMMAIVLILFCGCTDNQRVKNFGGTSMKQLQKNEKLVNVTWKDDNLWILTRPMREGEVPEEYKFKCDSSFGIFEGQIVIEESK